jgi:hypothetical protein
MGAYLAVDELEAAPGIGDLLTEAGGKFGKQLAVFAGSGFSVEVQLGDLAGEQCALLGIKGGDVALGVLDLASNADQLGGSTFTGDGGVDLGCRPDWREPSAT